MPTAWAVAWSYICGWRGMVYWFCLVVYCRGFICTLTVLGMSSCEPSVLSCQTTRHHSSYSHRCILITNLMHWLLFIHKILFSCTCFEPQVLIFRRIQLYTCSIWYCHSLWEFLVACRYTAWVWIVYFTIYSTAWVSSHSSCVPTGHQELS